MPIYEYECSCGNAFEKLESISSTDKETTCPKCGGTAKRKISLSSYHLTGSGFYNTDYKQKPKSDCPSAGPSGCCANCPAANANAGCRVSTCSSCGTTCASSGSMCPRCGSTMTALS